MPRKRKRYPGVDNIEGNIYRIRATYTCPRTGARKEIDRKVEAPNGLAASAIRAQAVADELAEAKEASAAAPRMRVSKYFADWLAARKGTFAYSTVRSHAARLGLAIKGPLGNLYCDAMTRADVQSWFQDLHEAGYSPTTIAGIRQSLRQVCADMQEDLLLPRNPCRKVFLPEKPQKRSEDDPNLFLTIDEMVVFLDAAEAHEPRWYPLICTMIWTGLRFGEATALRWSDIDEAGGVIRVVRGQVNGVVGDTKTAGSRRQVPLTPPVAQALREHRRRLIATQARGVETGYVFPNKVGGLMWSGCLSKPFKRIYAKLDQEYRVKPHGLRRTINNYLRQETTGQVTRSITGHVTEQMTELYSVVSLVEKREALLRVQMRTATVASDGRSDVGSDMGLSTNQTA